LRDHCLFDGHIGIAQIDVPKTTNSVQGLVAVDIGNEYILRAGDNFWWVGLSLGWMCHGLPKLARIVFLDKIYGFHSEVSMVRPS
jgi:hypothetical protein